MSWFKILLLALFLNGVIVPTVLAQGLPDTSSEETKPALPAELSEAAIRDAISKMDDAQVRQMLIERLDAVVAEANSKKNQVPLDDYLVDLFVSTADDIEDAVLKVPNIPGGVANGIDNFFGPKGVWGTLRFFGLMMLTLVGAVAIAFGADRLFFNRWRKNMHVARTESLFDTLRVLGMRFMFDVSGLVVFSISLFVILRILMRPGVDFTTAGNAFWSLLIVVLGVASFSRFLLAPNRSDLRLVHADDKTARFFHRHALLIAFIVGLIDFLWFFLMENGVELGQLRLLFWVNVALYIVILQMVWRGRQGITDMLLGGEAVPTMAQIMFARAWPYIAMALVAGNWLLIEFLSAAGRFDLLEGQQNVAMALILLTPAFDTGIRGLVLHLAPPMQGEGELAELAYERTKKSYVRIGRVLLIVLEVYIVAAMWGIDLGGLASDGFGARIASVLVEGVLFLAVGYFAWEVVTLLVNRKLASERTAAGGDAAQQEETMEIGGAGGSRLSTVLPIVLKVVQVAIIVLTVLLALAQVGIDITPLLAGAGIVGLAIGFGAQTLVRDVVSGIFFLLDDAFRIGEYIEVGDTRGSVEKISIRSVQLRHHRGAVHTVPYGEIPKVTNHSRDWAIMKLRFTLPFGTDTEKVRKIFKRIGQEMLEDEELGEDFLQPFKSQGVLEFDDVGIVMRGKFMAKPGKQFVLRKEIFRRIQDEFEKNDIEFARKEVRVRVPDHEGEAIPQADLERYAAAAAESQVNPKV